MLRDYLAKLLKKVLQIDGESAIAAATVPPSTQPNVKPSALEEPTVSTTKIEQIIQKVRPYSMVPNSGLEFLIQSVQSLVNQQIEGDFVECGVWKGGCAAAMKLAEDTHQPTSQRLLHLFDSYEGLPSVQPIDGPMAKTWQQAVDSPGYFDNCMASLELVQQNFAQFGLLDTTVQFYKGWFETTVPAFVKQHPETKIALFRLDGDWYESTKVCLENLYPLVSEKGVIIMPG